MSSSSPWQSFLDFVRGLFGSPTPPAQPGDGSLAVLTPRVLTVVLDPIVDPARGTSLLQTPLAQNWNSVDELLSGFIADVEECSGGLVRFREVARQIVDHFPLRSSGERYTGPDFMQALAHTAPVNEQDLIDYRAFVDELHLLERVAADEFDEVFVFGPPYAGFYETIMVGAAAFWCNAPPLVTTGRRFVISGFNYERYIGEMLEDLGHRAESMLSHLYGEQPSPGNLWERFSRYDRRNPGQAEVGLMHWAPNSRQDYDWGNCGESVPSKCDDWYQFPNLTGLSRMVTCNAWGGGDIRKHHKWWFKHLPKVAGTTNGIRNNWWWYIVNVAEAG